jgi:Ca2+-transporting ATPase
MEKTPNSPPSGVPWHRQSYRDIVATLHTSEAGLTPEEAARRLIENGENSIIQAHRRGPVAIFAAQFQSLIIWVLIFAGVLSGVLGQFVDAIAILAVVLLHAGVGFFQEFSAANSIAALRLMTSPKAKVLRKGEVSAVYASSVVIGDVLLLEAGDLVAADARVVADTGLTAMEAALTGESEVVGKQSRPLDQNDLNLADRTNMLFMGTAISAGTGRAVVVATGMNTELGNIARLIGGVDTQPPTPLQRQLDVVGRVLVWTTLSIVVALFGLGLWRGTPLVELFLTSVSLAVAAVPEGLPAVVTVALSIGVMRMSGLGALVRRLPAVETLGSATVICTDKTGTLTLGEMTARALFVGGRDYTVTGEGYGPEGEVLISGVPAGAHQALALQALAANLIGCNNSHLAHENGSWSVVGDPTEGALLVAGRKAGGNQVDIERAMPELARYPFDSGRKRSSVLRRVSTDRSRLLVNGAPGPLLALCTQVYGADGVRPMRPADRQSIVDRASSMARLGLRVLGSARRDFIGTDAMGMSAQDAETSLVFVGLTGLYDPPRPEAKAAIAKCRGAGIRVIMITGDHPETAMTIAGALGIVTAVAPVTGTALDAMSEEAFNTVAPDASVYARVTAEQKLRIVQTLQRQGGVVAMTGDGVNDAPAITGADIGIAMGRGGTEVTRQAADIILVDDNFGTIVAAVEQGRGIYDNIRKTLQYLLAGNAGELMLMAACVVAGLPAPLLPIHLLWINLVTDGLPALCLAGDPIDKGMMTRSPRSAGAQLIDGAFIRAMLITGALTGGVALAVFVVVLQTYPLEVARTCAFTALVFAELLRSLGARSRTRPIWTMSPFTNRGLLGVLIVSVGLQFLSQHNLFVAAFLQTATIPWEGGLILLAVGCIPLLALETMKLLPSPSTLRSTSPDGA